MTLRRGHEGLLTAGVLCAMPESMRDPDGGGPTTAERARRGQVLVVIWHLLASPEARFADLGVGVPSCAIAPLRPALAQQGVGD